MRSYRVTPRARDDIKSIGIYTQQKWGRVQRSQYLKQLEQRFEWLAQYPLLGKYRADIAEGFYSYLHREHVVFYRITPDFIDIIGVVHQEMDTANYFNNS